MIRIYGEISQPERKFLNLAIVSTLDRLTSRRKRKNCDITVVLKSFNDCEAETTYEVDQNGTRKFSIRINTKGLRKSSKIPIVKFKRQLMSLFHELVHVKQWINGELVQFQKSVRFKGEKYDLDPDADLAYYGSPEEIEARGYEEYLYVCFKKLISS